jgi:hypothetical protein
MAHESTPDHIRDDMALRAEFMPDELDGLGDDLTWRSPEMIKHDREMRVKCKELEARYEASRKPRLVFERAGEPHPTPQ